MKTTMKNLMIAMLAAAATSAALPLYAAPGDVVTLTAESGDITLYDGEILTGTGGANTYVVIADDATVTLSNATVVAATVGDGEWAGITCEGDATIILKGVNEVGGFDGGYPGIQAGPAGSTLVIAGDGSLDARGRDGAVGIGSCSEGECGDIVIEDGIITTMGGAWAVGIGGSDSGECGDITIAGGTVTATGGEYAAGIGASDYASCGDITIAGGTVSATGGLFAGGVGCGVGGECGDIAITDGVTLFTSVKNTADTNIGAYSDTDSVCGTVTVGGTVTGKITVSPYVYRPSSVPYTVSFDANGGSGSMAGQTFAPGIPQNLSSNAFTRAGLLFHQWNTAADGSGATYYDTQLATFADNVTLYAQWTGVEAVLSAQTGDLLVASGQTLTGTGGTNTHVVVAAGATVTLRDVSIVGETDDENPKRWAGITCLGDAVIILEGTNVVRGFDGAWPGLQAGPAGSTLVIRGTGTLTADSNGGAPGIGVGNSMSCGNIVIEGGTITAAGGGGAAGIGAGGETICGDISIVGGAVTATGGVAGAGIGSGGMGQCGDITIDGGIVTATGGNYGAGIGSGSAGQCGAIAIGGGNVTATGGYRGAGIGGGEGGLCGDITIDGDTVTATGGDSATGIGSGYDGECGDIVIEGGTVTAAGGEYAAGIGSGHDGKCDDIVIEGGIVIATGSDYGAGIGSGYRGQCSSIAINGGSVTATGDDGGAGIGSGNYAFCGDISIASGVTRVVATHGDDASNPIGAGVDGTCGAITVAAGLTDVTEGDTRTISNFHLANRLVHYTFDDAGNGGLNLLQAAVGADAIVRTNQAVAIAGLGDVAPVADAAILTGLDAGDGAVAIPRGYHLAVPIPAALTNAPGHPYTVVMKIKIPSVHDWVALLNMPASNDTDEMVFLNQDEWRICLKPFTKESDSALLCDETVVPDQWTTLAFAFGTNTTEVLFDGECVFSGGGALAGSYADCSAAGGYILVGADDNGDDALFYLADFQILDGTPPPPPYEPEVVLTPATRRVRLQDGQTLTGTGGTNTHVVIAAGATVTLSNATVVAATVGDRQWAGITCEGDATIILKGDNEVGGFDTGYPGIQAGPAGSTLVIAGDGSLDARGGEYAVGIGAGYASCGDIVIAGGTVTATGGLFAGGVGCGRGGECGDISITDGVTLFTSVKNSADTNIGAYSDTDSICGSVTVGGTVTGKITVSPYVYRPSSVPYTVSFDANGGSGAMADQTFAPGIPQNLSSNTFTCAGLLFHQWNTAADGSGATYYDAQLATFADNVTLYAQWTGDEAVLTAQTGDLLVVAGQTLTGTGGTNTHVVIAAGATVTLRDVSIVGEADDENPKPWAGITCLGDAVIILEGTNVVRGFYGTYPGLQAGPAGSTLVIRGTGALTADSNGGAPGIGVGNSMPCGNIVIEGGTITAAGGGGAAAGIGGSGNVPCGDIAICGGTVTATGSVAAAGIGSGSSGQCGDITIDGGIVTATGGNYGAGIGSGSAGRCGAIAIGGGNVTATGGNRGPGIGGGEGGSCGDITIDGGTVTATGGGSAAGIGSGYYGNCGDIVIEDGTVTAVGGGFAAGIGSGHDGKCDDIVIEGGIVIATGGDNGAGIGSGYRGQCSSIAINGGSVTATGDDGGAGIGSGNYAVCGAISIASGVTRVVATHGDNASNPIGAGVNGTCGAITVAVGLADVTEGDTRTIASAAYPAYLADADASVKSNYVAWAAQYGPDTSGEHEAAFLLNIDPATSIPAGAALLRVAAFSMASGRVHFDIVSDVAPLAQKANQANTTALCNGYLAIYETSGLSGVWTSLPVSVTVNAQGHAIAELELDANAPGGVPPALFFRPALTATSPADGD